MKNLECREAQKKVSKTAKSANIRAKRQAIGPDHKDYNKKYCPDCGFRIRSARHADGAHHNGNVPACTRG